MQKGVAVPQLRRVQIFRGSGKLIDFAKLVSEPLSGSIASG
jgi:hypothetical protein